MIVRRLLSFAVGIQTPSADLFDEFSQFTAPLPSLPPETPLDIVYQVEERDGKYRIWRDGILEDGLRREEVFIALQEDLITILIQNQTFGLLHAAVLTKGEHSVLLAGKSRSGKTTLTALLLKHGYLYLSDEFAPISFDLTVRSYPLPLRLRESALRLLPSLAPELTLWPDPFWASGERIFYGLPASRLLLPDREWSIGLIAFPRLCTGGSTETRRIKPGIAALRLMALMINSDVLGEAGFKMAADLVQTVPCYDLTVGDVETAARLIETL